MDWPDLNLKRFVIADEEHAATGIRYINWRPEKNCIEGVKTSHTILPTSLVQNNTGNNAGSD